MDLDELEFWARAVGDYHRAVEAQAKRQQA